MRAEHCVQCGDLATTVCQACEEPLCDRCGDSEDPLNVLCPPCSDQAYGEDE